MSEEIKNTMQWAILATIGESGRCTVESQGIRNAFPEFNVIDAIVFAQRHGMHAVTWNIEDDSITFIGSKVESKDVPSWRDRPSLI
jgi:hypothetical protein